MVASIKVLYPLNPQHRLHVGNGTGQRDNSISAVARHVPGGNSETNERRWCLWIMCSLHALHPVSTYTTIRVMQYMPRPTITELSSII